MLYAGFIRQPKWGHLRDLHNAIKQCEGYLVNSDPTYMPLGAKLEVHTSHMFVAITFSDYQEKRVHLDFLLSIRACLCNVVIPLLWKSGSAPLP